jgi:hypothetical protein
LHTRAFRIPALLLVGLLAAASVATALRTPVATDDGSDPIAGKSIGQLNQMGMNDPRFAARVAHFLADHGVNHPLKADLHGLTPLQAAKETLTTDERDGRTPVQWVQLAKAQDLLALAPTAPSPDAPRPDLAADVARLDADAGAPLTSAQRAELARDVAALQPDVRAAFADLVHAVLVSYEAQMPVAQRAVQALHAAKLPEDLVLSDADRETTLSNALAIVAAENAFRHAAHSIDFPRTSAPLFADPEGLVILGSTGNDVYTHGGALGDPILLVDPAGDDTYENSAGGACADALSVGFHCNGLVVSAVLDLQGNDSYVYDGVPQVVQGAGAFGSIGLLTDVTGDDHYQSVFARNATRAVFSYVDAGSQGQGLAGLGMLIDGTGNDWYEADISDQTGQDMYDLSQGFGDVGGIGILADGGGDNKVLDYGTDGGGSGFQGVYNGGTGMYGGAGILASTGGGNSQYHAWDNSSSTDFYAWGFAGFGGLGIFYDDGGNDDYAGVEDSYHNTVEIPLLNCAFGTSSYAGLGIFLDMGGNDVYYSDTIATGGVDRHGNPLPGDVFTQSEGFGGPTEGEGLFVDAHGDDGHFMQAHPNNGPNAPQYTTGRGVTLHGGEGLTGNTFGVYLDLDGHDQYQGAAPSADNAYWGLGADLNDDGSVPAIDPSGVLG